MTDRLAPLLTEVLKTNEFYRAKYCDLDPAILRSVPGNELICKLPFTTKPELMEDQHRHPPFGTNLTYPVARYTRMHQTSGTTGAPIRWLDTPESWDWWLDCWGEIYRAAGVTAEDTIFLAFSFGPFIGFWTAFEAGQKLGAIVIPGGALSTAQRIETMAETGATVLVCTPTYALRLGEVARERGIDLSRLPVRVTIHAGEPGASIPNIKARIEETWGARTVDHVGATEVGAWGFSCGEGNHVHINVAEFIPEVVDENTGEPVPETDGVRAGELVLTNLGRVCSPAIRYRTGDYVRLVKNPCACGRTSPYLEGGVIGRVDGMMVIRGVNVYPSALENMIRDFDEVVEFEVIADYSAGLTELVIKVELEHASEIDNVVKGLTEHVRHKVNLRPKVEVVPPGSLPRYELKAHRFRTVDSSRER